MKETLIIKSDQKYKNIRNKYVLHIEKTEEKLLGDTVIAGKSKKESFECVEIVYEGTIEKWKQIPKGSRYWVDDIDMWGTYYYHNDEGSYRPDKEYIPWIIGYKKVIVHCEDGDYGYDPMDDENNPAETHDIEKNTWDKIKKN